MRRASILIALSLVACGGRVTGDSQPSDAAIADAQPDTTPPPPPPPPTKCPASQPAPFSPCTGSQLCGYPCGPVGGGSFRCVGGSWRQETFCETPPPPPPGGTVGKACFSSDECDVTGEGIYVCARDVFSEGALYPTPVCIGVECEPGAGPTPCGGEGICLSTSGGGICLPRCVYNASGAAPTGCLGKNLCWPYGKRDGTNWWGYCFGGCAVDADCPAGNRCERHSATCVKTPSVPTKPIGAPCTEADSKSNACQCLYSGGAASGYCSEVCRYGTSSCPTGYDCDPMIPLGEMSKLPIGLGAYCLKRCASDGECAPGSRCEQHAGMSFKTCGVAIFP